MEANQLLLTGTLAQLEALRYTPAGVPLIECRIRHESKQIEANSERMVQVEIPAIAIGEMARKVSQLNLAQPLRVTGFLAQKSQKSQQIVLHICSLENI
ncbi:primosomal replication protein N [Sulfuriferula thiophila]|uniref:primosomal replication protein N n=1 Tax=Sulfuriferula thiophila TaxID=1781211 RepID=UPI000F6045DB|nr:primosomal replication protein N [Sulfuriferula thiophila]